MTKPNWPFIQRVCFVPEEFRAQVDEQLVGSVMTWECDKLRCIEYFTITLRVGDRSIQNSWSCSYFGEEQTLFGMERYIIVNLARLIRRTALDATRKIFAGQEGVHGVVLEYVVSRINEQIGSAFNMRGTDTMSNHFITVDSGHGFEQFIDCFQDGDNCEGAIPLQHLQAINGISGDARVVKTDQDGRPILLVTDDVDNPELQSEEIHLQRIRLRRDAPEAARTSFAAFRDSAIAAGSIITFEA